MANPVLADNQFWLQIMGDHAIIIYENLAPLEAKEIQRAQEFLWRYTDLLDEARKDLPEDQVKKLIENALNATLDFRDYKLNLLTRMLTDVLRTTLTTAIVNHFVNEDNEYIYILGLYKDNTVPKFHPIHYNLFWLRDGFAHANFIENFISFPYVELRREASAFIPKLQALYNKALQFSEYLRTGLKDFPAMNQLSKDAYEQDRQLAEFIVDLEIKIEKKEVVMPLMILMLDHMYREECYYLTQLASVTGLQSPACDPAAPRKLLFV